MAARADELSLVTASQDTDWTFDYYADANVIKANITSPTVINNDDTDLVQLVDEPGYLYQIAPALPQCQGILTFASGSASVSGSESAAGYTTTATATVQGLNIEGILTADVVIGTISTLYPVGNAVPSVNFVGSYFQNLHINGQLVTVNANTAIFGPKPAGDGSYFNEAAVLTAMGQQYYSGWGNPNLPASAESQSNWTPAAAVADNVLQCSLVTGVTGVHAPATTYGNIIVIPGFGTVSLGNIKLTRTPIAASPGNYTYMFSLEMICAELEGQAKGKVRVIVLDTNGQGSTGGHGGPVQAPPQKPSKRPKL
jgi:hypothetical protein